MKRILFYIPAFILVVLYLFLSLGGNAFTSQNIARWENGKVYLTANHEKTDISNQISTETPYKYQYTDTKGRTHYIGIGGKSGKEEFGWIEYISGQGSGRTVRVVGRDYPQQEEQWENVFYDYLESKME